MNDILKFALKFAGKSAALGIKNYTFDQAIGSELKFSANCSVKKSTGTLWNQGRIGISNERIVLKSTSAALGVLGQGPKIDAKLSQVTIQPKTIKAGIFSHQGIMVVYGNDVFLLIGLDAKALLKALRLP